MADKNEGTGLLAVASGRDRFSATNNYAEQRRRSSRGPFNGKDRYGAKGPSPNPQHPLQSRVRSASTAAQNMDSNMKSLRLALNKRKMKKTNKQEKMD